MSYITKAHLLLRQQIQEETERFLKNGGVMIVVAPGVSGDSRVIKELHQRGSEAIRSFNPFTGKGVAPVYDASMYTTLGEHDDEEEVP